MYPGFGCLCRSFELLLRVHYYCEVRFLPQVTVKGEGDGHVWVYLCHTPLRCSNSPLVITARGCVAEVQCFEDGLFVQSLHLADDFQLHGLRVDTDVRGRVVDGAKKKNCGRFGACSTV